MPCEKQHDYYHATTNGRMLHGKTYDKLLTVRKRGDASFEKMPANGRNLRVCPQVQALFNGLIVRTAEDQNTLKEPEQPA